MVNISLCELAGAHSHGAAGAHSHGATGAHSREAADTCQNSSSCILTRFIFTSHNIWYQNTDYIHSLQVYYYLLLINYYYLPIH